MRINVGDKVIIHMPWVIGGEYIIPDWTREMDECDGKVATVYDVSPRGSLVWLEEYEWCFNAKWLEVIDEYEMLATSEDILWGD